MDDTHKIVAAILAGSLCSKAGSTDMDDYVVNYLEIARKLAERENAPPKIAITKSRDKDEPSA